jgi:ABC-2 type transport system permease protein
VHDPLVLIAAVALLLTIFCAFGVVVGIHAESWDQSAFVTNLVILPASFLGGVFYSISRLPSPWQEISHLNPLYYLIDAVRHGFLGTSDVPVGLSLGVGAVLAAACVTWSSRLFATGRRLKP